MKGGDKMTEDEYKNMTDDEKREFWLYEMRMEVYQEEMEALNREILEDEEDTIYDYDGNCVGSRSVYDSYGNFIRTRDDYKYSEDYD